jgi:RimJ/RimL family protein N-acetyltransferase
MTDVMLRPVRAAELGLFESALHSAEGTGVFQWYGFTSFQAVRRRFAEDGLLGPDGGALSVVHAEECVGRVEWFASTWGRPTTSTCWTIAVGLLPAWRGMGLGAAAQGALLEYLFGHTRAVRVQAYTDVDNLAERRCLERCGFALEGILRQAQWRDGGWHDLALYSVLREGG